MPLLISENDLVKVTVHYSENGSDLKFYEGPQDGAESEDFWFKRPDWGDQKMIMEGTMGINSDGVPIMDPHRYQDMKFKVLLRKWSLKYEDGTAVPVSAETIDRMHPDLVGHLDKRLDDEVFEPLSEEKGQDAAEKGGNKPDDDNTEAGVEDGLGIEATN